MVKNDTVTMTNDNANANARRLPEGSAAPAEHSATPQNGRHPWEEVRHGMARCTQRGQDEGGGGRGEDRVRMIVAPLSPPNTRELQKLFLPLALFSELLSAGLAP